MVITNKELVHNLAKMFDEIELTPAEVDEALREAGYDPDEIGAKMKAIADDALARGVVSKPVWGEPIVATCDKATQAGT
jgi:2-hydroxychromene-2-carboxylate isomerase